MAKASVPTSRFESIPLPQTVRDAFLILPKDQSYISHELTFQGKTLEKVEEPVLTSKNHGVYVGKFFEDTFAEGFQRFAGWGAPEQIYSDAFLEAALDYLFTHLAEGEKGQVIVARALSEIFNGDDDLKGAISVEDEMKKISDIAKRKFKKGPDALEVVNIEMLPEHLELFEKLRSCVKSDGVMDIEAAFGGGEVALGANPSTLMIAKFLHEAMKKNSILENVFIHTVPEKIRQNKSKLGLAKYYGLTEIAIRLREILCGRNIHMGVDRQGVYDDVIEKIVKGKKGGYKNIQELEPLLKLFEGSRFETVHVDTKKNYFHLARVKAQAWTRVAVAATMTLTAGVGLYETGKYRERTEHEEKQMLVRGTIADQLKEETFYLEDGPKFPIPKKFNVNHFQSIQKNFEEQLMLRYGISEGIIHELRPFIEEYLLQNKKMLDRMSHDSALLMKYIDLFLKERTLYFQHKGIQIGRPNAHLAPYLRDHKKIMEDPAEIVHPVKANSTPGSWNLDVLTGDKFAVGNFRMIGGFMPSVKYLIAPYELGIYTDQAGVHLLARDRFKEKYGEGIHYYTSVEGKRAAEKYQDAMRKYDLLCVEDLERAFNIAFNPHYFNYSPFPVTISDEDVRLYTVRHCEDFYGEFSYDVVLYHAYDGAERYYDVPVARKVGETHFTTAHGEEVAKRYFQAQRSHWFTGREFDNNWPF